MGKHPSPVAPSDIRFDEPSGLVRFALVARIDALRGDDPDDPERPLGRTAVARDLGLLPSQLSKRLTAEVLGKASSDQFVEDLQGYLQVREKRVGRSGGEFAAFRRQMLGRGGTIPSGLRVPGTFVEALADVPPRSIEDVLLAGAALANVREQAPTVRLAADLRRVSGSDRVDRVVEHLVAASCMPHTKARITTGITARLADWGIPVLRRHLEASPVAYRGLRVLTRMLREIPGGIRRPAGDELLLRDIDGILGVYPERGGAIELDPARGFYEEALRFTPGFDARRVRGRPLERSWEFEWVPDRLASIAMRADLPARQRSFAALCLAEGGPADRDRVHEVLNAFRASDQAPSGHGLLYAAESITNIMEWRTGTSPGEGPHGTPWPPPQPSCWLGTEAGRQVREVVAEVGAPRGRPSPLDPLPGTVRDAARHLAMWALLSPDITQRRTACDTLSAAGVAARVSTFIGNVITHEACPGFLREVGAAVLGYLGDSAGLPALVGLAQDTGRRVQTRRAAILALGDIRRDPAGLSTPVLLEALRQPEARFHDAALFAIASRARHEALPGVEPAPDPATRDAVIAVREAARGAARAAESLHDETDARRMGHLALWTLTQMETGAIPVNALSLDGLADRGRATSGADRRAST